MYDAVTDLRKTRRFFSLRTKFVLFISLIIVAVCSTLSWYFIEQRREFMTDSLTNTGRILAQNLAYNSRNAVFLEDQVSLSRLIDGVLEVEEVVYVIVTGQEGKILAARSKGVLTGDKELSRSASFPLYPDASLAKTLLQSVEMESAVTPFISLRGKTREIHVSRGKAMTIPVKTDGAEMIYDFGIPIMRRSLVLPLIPSLSLESNLRGESAAGMARKVYGVVQVGLTSAKVQRALASSIENVVLITTLIIFGGIGTMVLLAGRIITPLRRLAVAAQKVAEGDLTVSVEPTTEDEVGQLTRVFKYMIESLQERDAAIFEHILTITKQVRQLTALNKTGAAIASTLDLDKLLTTVLHLLVENMGFARMALVFYDSERRRIYGTRIAGVPEETANAAQHLELIVEDDGSIHADLLIHGRPVLVPDITAVASRMFPVFLELCRQTGVTSYVCAPMKSKDRILGFVAADRGKQPCSAEDLEVLMTIAHDMAVAIDNARAYQQLEQLTATLDKRVQERTQELQTANEKLRELDRLKSSFVSMVSHELRTPMTSIKGYVDNLLDGVAGPLNEKPTYYLKRVQHNVERLTRMINDLLDLSRIEAGAVKLQLGSVSIPELLNDVVEGFQTIATEKSVNVKVHSTPDLPLIQGDRDKLYQVLNNLIQNAIKFTPKGGTILAEAQAGPQGFVQICVGDTGCGIAAEELTRVFERFYRGESVAIENRGAGLGLAITKNLVELHHGRIWVESTPGEGSRFFFTVPISHPA
jgi:signal transduction histidine kinase/HAMP domain-containing protein